MPSTTITLDGHILDSLLLPKVLDLIIAGGAEYAIEEIKIGRTRHDPSHAKITIDAPEQATLDRLVAEAKEHGAV
ncbi:MAG TPA: hypothetical protein VFW40_00010 [Capsulimonadaceae bacterium]|nr:hypothetical protein [Capsulimonadaceae bacterium]